MNVDFGYIVLSVLFSGIGFVYFTYGKKQTLIPQMIIGLTLMIYPYFVDSKLWLVVIGVVLSALPRFL